MTYGGGDYVKISLLGGGDRKGGSGVTEKTEERAAEWRGKANEKGLHLNEELGEGK